MDYELRICFWDGISADIVKAKVVNEFEEVLESYEYVYGKHISADGVNLPTAGDVLKGIVEEWGTERITYSGYNVFLGKNFTDAQLQKRINALLEEI